MKRNSRTRGLWARLAVLAVVASAVGVVVPAVAPTPAGASEGDAYAAAVNDSSPVAFWRFNDDGTNAHVYDDVSGTYFGQFSGTHSWQQQGALLPAGTPSDSTNKSISVDEANFAATLANSGTGTPDDSRSIEVWFKTDTTPTTHDHYALINDRYTDAELDLMDTGELLAVAKFGSSCGVDDTELTQHGHDLIDGQWHHVTLEFASGRGLILYVDSQLVGFAGGGSLVQGCAGSDSNVKFGGGVRGDEEFIGNFDEGAVYDRLLPMKEVRAHYEASGRTPKPNPVDEKNILGGSNPSMFCLSCWLKNAYREKPVSVATGNFYHSFPGFIVPGHGIPLSFEMTYNSASAGDLGPLGYGWSSTWATHLDIDSDTGIAALVQDNGSQATFWPDDVGGFQHAPNVQAELTYDSGSDEYTVVRNLGETLTFNGDGQLISDEDLNGHSTDLDYVSPTEIDVTDPEGRTMTLTYDGAGYLTSVADPLGRTMTFDVNATTHRLDSFTDLRGQEWDFTYDSSNLMLSMADPDGNETHNAYDTEGRVTDQLDPVQSAKATMDQRPTHFEYDTPSDGDTLVSYGYNPGTSSAPSQELQHFEDGYLTSDTVGYGTTDAGTTTYTYDPDTGGVHVVTDPNGHTTTTEWFHDCPSPAAGCAEARPESVQYDSEPATDYEYDAVSGLPTKVTDPLGNETDTTYYDHTKVHTVTSHLAADSVYGSAADQVTTYSYGPDAHNPDGEDVASMTDPRNKEWDYEHNDAGQVTKQTSPLGFVTSMGYDPVGRQLWSEDPKGYPSNPDWGRSSQVLDDGGLPVASLSPNALGTVDSFARADGAITATETGRTWTTVAGTWVIDGRQAKMSAGTGGILVANQSTGDQIVGATLSGNQDGTGLVFRYQNSSNYWRITATPASNTYTISKTVFGSTSTVTTTGSSTCCNSGNPQHLTVVTSGSSITVYIDGIQVATVTDGALATYGVSAGFYAAAAAGTGRFDEFFSGRSVGAVTQALYDANGLATTQIDANRNLTTVDYDPDNRAETVHRPDTTTVGSAWDDIGNLVTQTDGANNDTTYSYDHQNRLHLMTPAGQSATTYDYAYDVGANSYGTRTITPPGSAGTITESYGTAGRLMAVDYSDSTPDIVFTYYDNGLPHTMTTGGSNTATWTYDSLNRLETSNRGNGTVTYKYDLGNNLTNLTYPGAGGGTVTNGYDNDGRWTSVLDWNSHTTSYILDANGNTVYVSSPNSVLSTTTLTYNNQPSSITLTDSASATAASFTYTRTPADQVASATLTGLGSNETYSYNSLNQLTGNGTDTYSYDAADNLTGLAGTQQKFNDANQLCWTVSGTSANDCATTPAGGTTYGYDARGNRTSKDSTTYGYDLANRLTSITGGTTYAYDGDGLRRSKTVSSTTTNYTWDESGSLPMLMQDGTDRYIYGRDGVPIERVASGGTCTYIHQDQLGSTRVLTDSTGTTANDSTYAYDPYGNQTSHTGSADVSIRFAGEYLDGESGFYYLRARYYDPDTGQFISEDPVESATRAPYSYGNDPQNSTDPLGLSSKPDAGKRTPIQLCRTSMLKGAWDQLTLEQQQEVMKADCGPQQELGPWGSWYTQFCNDARANPSPDLGGGPGGFDPLLDYDGPSREDIFSLLAHGSAAVLGCTEGAVWGSFLALAVVAFFAGLPWIGFSIPIAFAIPAGSAIGCASGATLNQLPGPPSLTP